MITALLNATTLNKGGALQVAVSFIRETISQPASVRWKYAVSPKLAVQLERLGLPSDSTKIVSPSPARSLPSRRKLLSIAHAINPDVVLTLFGPAYVSFDTFHACGIANAWTTHPNAHAYRTLNVLRRIQAKIGRAYRLQWLRHADAWIVEAEAARTALVRDLGFSADRIITVPNSCADHYRRGFRDRDCSPKQNDLNLLVLSAYYPHKHLELIPHVAAALLRHRPSLSFSFNLSLDAQSKPFQRIALMADKLGVSQHVRSIGIVDIDQGPHFYASNDIVFLPTLLETNTAVYHEAMAMGLPIVTTNMDFATSVCHESAVYFEPMNADSAAMAILRLVNDHDLWRACVATGKKLSESAPTQTERYHAYVRFIASQLNCRNSAPGH